MVLESSFIDAWNESEASVALGLIKPDETVGSANSRAVCVGRAIMS